MCIDHIWSAQLSFYFLKLVPTLSSQILICSMKLYLVILSWTVSGGSVFGGSVIRIEILVTHSASIQVAEQQSQPECIGIGVRAKLILPTKTAYSVRVTFAGDWIFVNQITYYWKFSNIYSFANQKISNVHKHANLGKSYIIYKYSECCSRKIPAMP